MARSALAMSALILIAASLSAQEYGPRVKHYVEERLAFTQETTFQRAFDLEHGRNGSRIDYAEAYRLYRKAAERGHPLAESRLAVLLRTQNYGIPADLLLSDLLISKSLQLIQNSAYMGSSNAKCCLILYIINDEYQMERDRIVACKWAFKGAQQGDSLAQLILAKQYALGDAYERDERESEKWLLLSAQGGLPCAQYSLGRKYYLGWGIEKNPGEGLKWIHRAAQKGHLDAINFIGTICCEHDDDFDKLKLSPPWFRVAAELNDRKSQYDLGLCYSQGIGVTRDDKEAMKWLRKAAEQGYCEAQLEVAKMYYFGVGVDFDDREAARWFRKAADQGSDEARESLVGMESKRYRFEPNDAGEQKWYEKIYEKGKTDYLGTLSNIVEGSKPAKK